MLASTQNSNHSSSLLAAESKLFVGVSCSVRLESLIRKTTEKSVPLSTTKENFATRVAKSTNTTDNYINVGSAVEPAITSIEHNWEKHRPSVRTTKARKLRLSIQTP